MRQEHEAPFGGLGAVHIARAMLSRYDTIPYSGINTCEMASPPPSNRLSGEEPTEVETLISKEYPAFNLYPNPNTGEFTVVLNMEEDAIAEIQVWSVSGQRVYSNTLVNGSNTLRLNVAEGLYLYGIKLNRELKWIGKISINTD